MSGNPFETSLKTLHEAAAIGQINAEVVRLLEQPSASLSLRFPFAWMMGTWRFFQAFRVHYCDALGQVKNGVRVVPDMDMDTAKALGFWMTIKHAVGGIPAGGGKGESRPISKLSRREYEALIRGFIRYLPMKGTWVDVPGADIGTHGQTQSWMLDELEAIQGFHSPAAINDKPIEANGTELSREATGTGAFLSPVRSLGTLESLTPPPLPSRAMAMSAVWPQSCCVSAGTSWWLFLIFLAASKTKTALTSTHLEPMSTSTKPSRASLVAGTSLPRNYWRFLRHPAACSRAKRDP